jgi:hypothetical protein
MNRLVQRTIMIATNNISTYPRDDAVATFCNSIALVEGRYRASRVRVVTSDFSATPNPLTAQTATTYFPPLDEALAGDRQL